MNKEEYIELYYDEILQEKYEANNKDEDKDEENEPLEKVYDVKPGIDFPATLYRLMK